MKYKWNLPLTAGLMMTGALLFQGCYTRLATIEEEEPSYEEQPDSTQTAQQYGDERDDYYRWRSHGFVGFDYYYPVWHSNWVYDPYWSCDPWYYDPWYSPWAYYWNPRPWWWYGVPVIAYYPWSHYPYYGYYGTSYGAYRWRTYATASGTSGTRNSGYRRTDGSGRGDYLYGGSSGGNSSVPVGGRVGRVQTGDEGRTLMSGSSSRGYTSPTSRSTPSASKTSGTVNRSPATNRSGSSRFRPAVQQPKHRDQTAPGVRWYETRSSGWSRSPQQSGSGSAPSYSPPARTSSPPASSPAPSSGGGRSGGSSGRNTKR